MIISNKFGLSLFLTAILSHKRDCFCCCFFFAGGIVPCPVMLISLNSSSSFGGMM